MFPDNPHIDEICIEDIAHALSLMTRANGHFCTFYSVAQHCVGCAQEAEARGYSKRVQLGCLLHDGSEAYISDITRPVKENLPTYIDIEKKLQNMIFDKWLVPTLTEEERAKVFEIDDTMLYNEFFHFTGVEVLKPKSKLVSKQNYEFEDFKAVESKYLEIFYNLT